MGKGVKPETYILLGIPVLFLIGGFFHFLYGLTGELFIAGLIAPVNESVFEHIKMAVLPVFLWWTLYYLFSKQEPDADVWFTAALLSMIVMILSIPMLYYFYTEAFGVEYPVVDVLILFVSICAGQLIGLHYYRHGQGINYLLAIFIMILIIASFAYFTIAPPELPIFQDMSQESANVKLNYDIFSLLNKLKHNIGLNY